jgi:hypothetical protein
MAIAAATLFEIAATGSDSVAGSDTNAGGFNPTNANFPTDLTATGGTGTAPVVSSATYSFQAGDVGHYVFMQSGASWTLPTVSFLGGSVTPVGIFAKISSVSLGAATLDAAIGHIVCYGTGGPFALSTTAGIATTATPSTGKFGVDYSQGGGSVCQVTDGVTAGTTTITSVSNKFHKAMVGNLCYITGGTGSVVAAVYEIVSDTGVGTIVVDRSTGLTAGTGVTVNVGGCLASPGQAGTNHVAGNHIFCRSATYAIAANTVNGSGNCISLLTTGAVTNETGLFGYNTFRTDAPKGSGRPTFKLNAAVSAATIVTLTADTQAWYLILDGNSQTTSRGLTSVANGRVFFVTGKNCTNSAFNTCMAHCCDATACTTQPAFISLASSYGCVAWSNFIAGFSNASAALINCISVNNTNVSSDGFVNSSGSNAQYINCVAYGNGRDGFHIGTGVTTENTLFNCIATVNTGVGFNPTAAADTILMANCYAWSNGTNFSANFTNDSLVNCQVLTGDPFNNASGGDFSLNNTAGAGAVCRAGGLIGAFPGISTTTYVDAGAAQHPDTPTISVLTSNVSVLDGPTRVIGS